MSEIESDETHAQRAAFLAWLDAYPFEEVDEEDAESAFLAGWLAGRDYEREQAAAAEQAKAEIAERIERAEARGRSQW